MHHHFGLKFLTDSLNSLGFCSSYSEVKIFEMSAARYQCTDIFIAPQNTLSNLLQTSFLSLTPSFMRFSSSKHVHILDQSVPHMYLTRGNLYGPVPCSRVFGYVARERHRTQRGVLTSPSNCRCGERLLIYECHSTFI